MPESGTKETRGAITTATTGTTINGITGKMAGTGIGGRNGTRLIVPSTRCGARSREHTGNIATNIRIVTIAANSPVLSADAQTAALTLHAYARERP
jgi:hypothetical protein